MADPFTSPEETIERLRCELEYLTSWNDITKHCPPKCVVWIASNSQGLNARLCDAGVYPGILARDTPFWRHTPESLKEMQQKCRTPVDLTHC